MPRQSPYIIKLSRHEREVLESRSRKYTLPYFEVFRAKMILLAAEGWSNDEIAAALSVGRDVVSLWRKRFFHERLSGLEVRARPGRPPIFPPEVVVQIKAIACELPATRGLPLSRLSSADIVREASAAALSRASAAGPFGDGCMKTPFAFGSTARGSSRAIQTLSSRRDAFLICMPDAGKAAA